MNPRVWIPLCERYDRSFATMESGYWSPSLYGQPYCAALFMRATRLFAAGDIVFEHIANGGGERWSFNGWSSKRRCAVTGFYLQYARHAPSAADYAEAAAWWKAHPQFGDRRYDDGAHPSVQHENRSTVQLVMHPDPNRERSWSDPDVRRLALSALRAAYSARPVSTNSGAFFAGEDPLPSDARERALSSALA